MKSWRTVSLIIVIAAVTLGLTIWCARQLIGKRLPTLDTMAFETARAGWASARPEDYRITTVVTGRQPATYTVEVRSGHALKAMRDGKPLTDQRTFKTWSVDGMFATMEHDVLRNEEAGENKPLHLGARFDKDWHFPANYLRIEWGTTFEVAWHVSEFEVLTLDEAMP